MYRTINTVVWLIQAMLALRLVLQLLGASGSAPFVAWVFGVTDGLVAPFAGAFPALTVAGFIVEFSTIFAMIGYAIIGWLVTRIVSFFLSSA